MSIQAMTAESVVPPKVSPYAKFKMALKSKEVQSQYPNNTNESRNKGKFMAHTLVGQARLAI